MKITYVEVGRTVTKDYQSKRLALGAEVGKGETAEEVIAELTDLVDEELSGRKKTARRIREIANAVEAGVASAEIDEDAGHVRLKTR